MREHRPYRVLLLSIVLLVIAALAICAPSEASRAASRPFEALSGKGLDEYDREVRRRGLHPHSGARTAFQEGLAGLAAYNLQAAQEAFAESRKGLNTYATTFNAALSHQLEHDLIGARELYLEAGSLEPADPMRHLNLARLLGWLGDRRGALEELSKAIALRQAGPQRGMILLHQGLVQWVLGEQAAALESLRLAEQAFATGGHALGAAVARAKRGNGLMLEKRAKEGEPLLLDAIASLETLGAAADEATARIDLALHYLRHGGQKAERHLRRGVELAQRAGALLPLARGLNSLGSYNLEAGRLPEAEINLQQAIDIFRRIRDRVGECEAANNLGALALREKRLDQAFERFDEAMRLYRKAGLTARAFDRAVALAEVFDAQNQPARARHFLDIATALGPRADIRRGRLLLALGQHHLASDPRAAERELMEARNIFLRLGERDRAQAALRLIEETRRRWQAGLFSYLLYGALALLAVIGLYSGRRHLRAFFARVWHGAATPVRSATRFWQTTLDRWAGEKLAATPEEVAVLAARETYRRRLVRVFFVVAILSTLAFDIVSLTAPHLSYVGEIRRIVTRWPFPPGVREHLQALLTRVTSYVVAHLMTQTLTFGLWLGAALLVYDVIDRGTQGVLRRRSGALDPPLNSSIRALLLKQMLVSGQRRLQQLFLIIAVAMGLYWYVVPPGAASVQHAGWGLLALVVVFQATRFVGAWRLIRPLPAQERGTAFDWLHRSARHQVISLFINIFVFVYVVTPAFYIATRAVQKSLIYPLFEKTTLEFSAVLFDWVRKFRFIILEADTFLIFVRMEQAYEPAAGAGQLWPDVLWPLLSYVLFAWGVVLFFRLALPLAWSFPRWQAVWKIVGTAAMVTVASLGLQYVAVHAFRVNRNSAMVLVALQVLVFIFAYYFRHAVDPGVVCPKCGCRNPSDANFCFTCGENLAALRPVSDRQSG